MSSISGIGGTSSVQSIQGLDLETAMMMVQTTRTNHLEGQLKAQMDEVAKRNDKIASMNQCINLMNQYMSAFPPDAKSDARLDGLGVHAAPTVTYNGQTQNGCQLEQDINTLLYQNGLNQVQCGGGRRRTDTGQLSSHQGTASVWQGNGVGGPTTKGQLEVAIKAVQSAIDAQSNSQQMYMLRLQSLSNKRNEAFDLMSNFIKKMQDGRSSILGNMR